MNILGQSREERNSFASADEVVVRACCCFNVSFVVFEVELVDEKGSVSSAGVPLCPLPLQPSVIDFSGSSVGSTTPLRRRNVGVASEMHS